MRLRTNRDILIRFFWDHATFSLPNLTYISDPWRALPAYLDLISRLTSQALEHMKNKNEQSIVRTLLTSRYGTGLCPRESELGFPSCTDCQEPASWQTAFDAFTALYGSSIAESRRTGKDLLKYKPSRGLLSTPLQFERQEMDRFCCVEVRDNRELFVICQEFPREHLYRLESGGTTFLEFDDWPVAWSRDWNTWESGT